MPASSFNIERVCSRSAINAQWILTPEASTFICPQLWKYRPSERQTCLGGCCFVEAQKNIKLYFYYFSSACRYQLAIILAKSLAHCVLGTRTHIFRTAFRSLISDAHILHPKPTQTKNNLPSSARNFSNSRSCNMKIATLQLAPKLGDIQGNIDKANALLKSSKSLSVDRGKPDILVLPELALTGMILPDNLFIDVHGLSLTLAIRL